MVPGRGLSLGMPRLPPRACCSVATADSAGDSPSQWQASGPVEDRWLFLFPGSRAEAGSGWGRRRSGRVSWQSSQLRSGDVLGARRRSGSRRSRAIAAAGSLPCTASATAPKPAWGDRHEDTGNHRRSAGACVDGRLRRGRADTDGITAQDADSTGYAGLKPWRRERAAGGEQRAAAGMPEHRCPRTISRAKAL